jgi:hypothetical protein
MDNIKKSEELELFVEEFGEASSREIVPEASFIKWASRLPNRLLDHWDKEGWASYSNGLIWFVNPELYEDIVTLWLEGTPYDEIDKYHVVARTAFGRLILWGENNNRTMEIDPLLGAILSPIKVLKEPIDPLESFRLLIGLPEQSDFDMNDESGNFLFKQALTKLGMLDSTDIYAFEPALVLGGKMRLENLVKVDLFVHNDLLRSLAPPKMPMLEIDFDQIIKDNS